MEEISIPKKSHLVIEPLTQDNPRVTETLAEISNKTSIPREYIPIQFASQGDLKDCPKILHARNYTMQDAINLDIDDEDERLKVLIETVSNLTYEKFDVRKLHPNDFLQLMLSLHASFLSNKIEKEYYINEDLPEGNKEGQLSHSSNIDKIEVPLNKLVVRSIRDTIKGKPRENKNGLGGKIKEPFKIKDSNTHKTFGFRLSRMEDTLIASDFCNNYYSEEIIKYKPLKRALYKIARETKDPEERERKIDELMESNIDEYEEYEKFLKKQAMLMAKIAMVCTIDGYVKEEGNTKIYTPYETINQKIDAFESEIPATMWEDYSMIANEYQFGIDPSYNFFCDKLQKNITRRFQFQFLEFIPTDRSRNSKQLDVSFD